MTGSSERLREAVETARPSIEAVPASSVKRANVRWLWDGWIPLAMQSALVGMPGFGKTTLAMLLAADTTKGRLPGDLEGAPADVLFISYEDALEVRLRPMAEAAGADLDRLHFVKTNRTGELIDLTSRLPEIEQLARARRARLLVIDPLVAGLPAGRINSHRDQDVRAVLAPMAALAEACDLAVLTLGHFAKAAMSALLGTGGSIGFVGAPRSILAFGPDPNDEQGVYGRGRVLAHAKCNVGKLQRSRGVEVMEHVLDPFGAPVETSRAVLGDEVDATADDLVRPSQDGGATPRERAFKWLRELLTDGRHKASEAFKLAGDDGISERTLKRAKDDLDVISYQEGRVWWWELPGEPEDESKDEPETEGS